MSSDQEALEAFRARRRSYQLAFGSPAGQDILNDLADFCCAAVPCVAAQKGHPVDVHRTMILEGRREVWLRIQKYLNLTPEHIFLLATGRHVQIEQETEDDGPDASAA